MKRHETVGFLILRLFFAQFWVLQMIGKARDQESGITSVHNLGIWSQHTSEWMARTTPLPTWMLEPFTTGLPFVEVTLGTLLLIGLATRYALAASALLIISLDVGLMFQLKHDVVATNTIYLLAIVLALAWQPYNRFALDNLFGRAATRPAPP
jgi:thiosulfate dehydrogenase [quinone] large subunit